MSAHSKADNKIEEVSREEHEHERDGGSDVVLVESHEDPPVAAEAGGAECSHTNGEETEFSTIILSAQS
jgi:hypothetical protein